MPRAENSLEIGRLLGRLHHRPCQLGRSLAALGPMLGDDARVRPVLLGLGLDELQLFFGVSAELVDTNDHGDSEFARIFHLFPQVRVTARAQKVDVRLAVSGRNAAACRNGRSTAVHSASGDIQGP